MERLSVNGLGLALGGTFAMVYLGCAVVMSTVPRDAAVRFFNSITHGVDWTVVMRWETPWWEMIIGVTEVAVLGWLMGAVIAGLYNLGARGVR